MMGILGVELHCCATMDDAVAWFALAAAAGAPPDIIFMDMQLADPCRVRA